MDSDPATREVMSHADGAARQAIAKTKTGAAPR